MQNMQKKEAPVGKGTLDQRYVILSDLGDGGNAEVKLAFDLVDQVRVAVKVMKNLTAQVKEEVVKEANVMMSIDHPNVLKVIAAQQGMYVSQDGVKKYQCYYIVLELAQKDSLFDYIVDQAAFPEPVAAYLFYQFLRGLHAVHEKTLCHRDIKCENVLLSDNFYLKVADFGYAANVQGHGIGKHGHLYSIVGTKGQIAPEIEELHAQLINKQQPVDGYRGDLVDIFNAGIVLFCMIFQRFPFKRAVSQDRCYKYIVADDAESFWAKQKQDGLNVDGASSDCKKLIYSLLYREPEMRISISEALASPWFQTQSQQMTVDQIVQELQNRKAHMLLLREAEEQTAQVAQSSNLVHRGQGAKRCSAGIQRTLYAQNDFCRTKFLVKGDPYVIFQRIENIVRDQLGAEPQPKKNGKFKIRFNKIEILPIEKVDAKEDTQIAEAEVLEMAVSFSIKIMATHQADLGKPVQIREHEDQESKDLYVSFQRDSISDYDMFMDCYQQVKKKMLSVDTE